MIHLSFFNICIYLKASIQVEYFYRGEHHEANAVVLAYLCSPIPFWFVEHWKAGPDKPGACLSLCGNSPMKVESIR